MRRNQSHGGFTITRQEVERKIRICQQPIIFPPPRQSAKENHWHLVPTYFVLLGSAKIDQIGKVSKFRFKLVDLTERRLMAISNIPGKAGRRSGPGLPQRRPPSSLPGSPWVLPGSRKPGELLWGAVSVAGRPSLGPHGAPRIHPPTNWGYLLNLLALFATLPSQNGFHMSLKIGSKMPDTEWWDLASRLKLKLTNESLTKGVLLLPLANVLEILSTCNV